MVRWFGTEIKAADVEKTLADKPFVKGLHTHPADNLVCVNYYGQIKDIDIVRKNTAGGNAIILSPAKVVFNLKAAKGAKNVDGKKAGEKVAALKGTLYIDSITGTTTTLYIDPSKFDWKKAQEAAKSEGFDLDSSTHEIVTVSFKFVKEGQVVDPMKKAIVKQKGVMLVLDLNDFKCTLTLFAEKGVKDDVLKNVVVTAGFEAGDVKRE